MSKKVINGVLIAFMLVIWAIVFNKIFNFIGNDPVASDLSANRKIINTSAFNFSKDTFKLKKIARDPFLEHTPVIKKNKVSPKKTTKKSDKKKSIKKPVIHTEWPKLNYYGYIRGHKSKSKLILIKIDDKLHKLREGDKIDELIIKKVFHDSITIKKNTEIKTLYKN